MNNAYQHFMEKGNTEMPFVEARYKEIQAKEVNSIQLEDGYEKYTEQLLGIPKVIFALDPVQCERVLKEFKERMRNNALPEPAIVDICIKEDENMTKEETIEQKMKRWFPGIQVIDD